MIRRFRRWLSRVAYVECGKLGPHFEKCWLLLGHKGHHCAPTGESWPGICRVIVQTFPGRAPVRVDPINHLHLPGDPDHTHEPGEELWSPEIPPLTLVCTLDRGHDGEHRAEVFKGIS